MGENSFTVPQELDGLRLDMALARLMPQMSRSALQRIMEEGGVSHNGRPAAKSLRVRQGDALLIDCPAPRPLEAQAEDIPLIIPYEDEDLLIVNKPKGMVVHPAPGHTGGTLVNALLWHCRGKLSGINGVLRPGIVHRIDKDTSGLLAVAKTDAAHRGLAQQIASHSFLRAYEAVVYGALAQPGTVDAPIGRCASDRKKMAVTEKNAKPARTHYETLAAGGGFTHLRLRLETGRTHQIRVHMAYIGHPVAGDPVYGPKKVITELQGQCLHARLLGFTHPITGKQVVVDSGLPEYFTSFLKKISLSMDAKEMEYAKP